MNIICKKCKSDNIKIYEDKVKEEMSLCICLKCSNSGMKYEFDER